MKHAQMYGQWIKTWLFIYLKSFARFLKTGAGDVKQLHGFDPPLHRLRIGDALSSGNADKTLSKSSVSVTERTLTVEPGRTKSTN
jgi:hypothetical protein